MTLGMAGIILCYPVAYWSFIMAYLVAVGSTKFKRIPSADNILNLFAVQFILHCLSFWCGAAYASLL